MLPPILPFNGPQDMKMLILTVIAGIGGALSYMWRETKAGRSIKLFRAGLSACLVAFICFHLGFIYLSMGLSEPTIWALNGFTSVIGVEVMMTLVAKITFRIMGVDENDILNKKLVDSGWTPPGGSAVSGMGQTPQTEPATTNSTTDSSDSK